MKKRFATKAGIIIIGVVVAGAALWYVQDDNGSASPSVFSSEPVASTTVSDAVPTASDAVPTVSDAVPTAFDAATPQNITPVATSTPATQAAGQVAGQSMRRYSNASFHFSLLYPDTLQVVEYKEQGGALTVTFESSDGDQQFQIYVTPYGEKQVSAQRFKQDEPSGVRLQPTDVMVAGTRATMFFSTNPVMGDTREVWFIRGGYLYEVTTYKDLDAWLGGIMQTWQFI